MTDLHQYELHYRWIDPATCCAALGKRLLWAYTVQEAVSQLELELSQKDPDHRITKAGPVKEEIRYGPHFHLCPECQDVSTCGGCGHPERSDGDGPCGRCVGKKPHQHHCSLCEADYDCMWIEKFSYCGNPAFKDVPCASHTEEEIRAFFQKKMFGDKKATR